MKSVANLLTAILLTITLLFAANPALAETWQNGGNGLWANPANWSPSVPTSSTSAVFDSAGSTTVNLGGASRDLLNLVFNAGAQSYTLTGNAGDKLSFSSGGSISSNAAVAEII